MRKRTKKEQAEMEKNHKEHQRKKTELEEYFNRLKTLFPKGVLKKNKNSTIEVLDIDMNQYRHDLITGIATNFAERLQANEEKSNNLKPERAKAGKKSAAVRKNDSNKWKEKYLMHRQEYLKRKQRLDNRITESEIIKSFISKNKKAPSHPTTYYGFLKNS